MANNVYQYVTDRIISELEKGKIPWRKPWKGQKAINYLTRKEYRGINTLLLPYPGEYLTFRQVKEKGGSVKKGEKSSMIVYYNWYEKEDQDGNKQSYPILRYYNVFHISQTEGIETKLEEFKPENENDIITEAENTITDYITRENIKLEKVLGSDRAYYSPAEDKVVLPEIGQFSSTHDYYSTVFHELVHSTGHESRLNRIKNTGIRSFGSESYSKEELIAEIGSSMICNTLNIDIPETFKNSVAYIQSWLTVLKNDVRLVVIASGQAQKASNRILGITDGEKVEEA